MPIDRAKIRASALAGYREFLDQHSVALDDLLAAVGVDPAAFSDPDAEVPLNAVALLMEFAAEKAHDPCLSLRYAEAYRAGASGLMGYLVLHAPTVREVLRAFERYLQILARPIDIRFREEGALAKLSWRFRWDISVPREQLVVFVAAILVLRIRHVAGAEWRPRLVEIDHREPACADELERIVGCEIRYNCAASAIVLDGAVLRHEAESADPQLFPILQLAGEAKLQQVGDTFDLVTRTCRAIADNLSGSPPFLERVAASMRMSPRSLQNRLAREGTSFEKVVCETRRSLAVRYLRDTDLPMTEIAFQLGFSELSAFTRAARGWFGAPPREVRARLARGKGRFGSGE